jgi:hypothetical protein
MLFLYFHVKDIWWRDRVTYISPVCDVQIYSADVAVGRRHRHFGDYTKENDKQHNRLRFCNYSKEKMVNFSFGFGFSSLAVYMRLTLETRALVRYRI